MTQEPPFRATPEPTHDKMMIDIESLALTPDALVLSIGAIMFSMSPSGPNFGAEFFATPGITEQILMGRRVDPETQGWWATQPSSVQAHWRYPVDATSPIQAMQNLRAFIVDEQKPKEIWANGIVFDIGVLEHLFAQTKVFVPWKYDAIRDARTYYKVMEPQHEAPVTAAAREDMAHHPLGDCRSQITRLWMHGLK